MSWYDMGAAWTRACVRACHFAHILYVRVQQPVHIKRSPYARQHGHHLARLRGERNDGADVS